MGGVSGLVASTLPVLVLVPVNSIWGLTPALVASVAVALAVFIWRWARKENLQPAFSGMFAVLIGAGIAVLLGDAKGFFLYGIWYSALLAVIFTVSMLLRRPAVGYIWEGLNSGDSSWVRNPVMRKSYQIATGAWAVVFAARFLVQHSFYNADEVEWLGVARVVMGWPLTGIALLICVWAVRRARHAQDTLSEQETHD
nr:DUF3159 domain-containing protein [Corynebacterium sp. TAE3-ERU12]